MVEFFKRDEETGEVEYLSEPASEYIGMATKDYLCGQPGQPSRQPVREYLDEEVDPGSSYYLSSEGLDWIILCNGGSKIIAVYEVGDDDQLRYRSHPTDWTEIIREDVERGW